MADNKKLSENEQKQLLQQLEEKKKKFAETYKKWLDQSSNTRKEVDPKLCMKGSYRDVTAQGRATIDSSILVLGFKLDEKIYIRPVYNRDTQSLHYFPEAEWVVVDGNHRVDWWNRHTDESERPAKLKCAVFRGKQNQVEMSEDEEEQLAKGLNALHDEGSVHASDLQKILKFMEVKDKPELKGLSGASFIAGAAIILEYSVPTVRDIRTIVNSMKDCPQSLAVLQKIYKENLQASKLTLRKLSSAAFHHLSDSAKACCMTAINDGILKTKEDVAEFSRTASLCYDALAYLASIELSLIDKSDALKARHTHFVDELSDPAKFPVNKQLLSELRMIFEPQVSDSQKEVENSQDLDTQDSQTELQLSSSLLESDSGPSGTIFSPETLNTPPSPPSVAPVPPKDKDIKKPRKPERSTEGTLKQASKRKAGRPTSTKIEQPLSEKAAQTAALKVRTLFSNFDDSIYKKAEIPETAIILLNGVSSAALQVINPILSATEAIGVAIVLNSDLAAAFASLAAEKYKVDRVITVHLANTPKKNSKGGQILDTVFVIVFLPKKSKLAVTVEKESPGALSTVWNLKYVGKAEHKAAKTHKFYRHFSWRVYSYILQTFYHKSGTVLEYGTEYCSLLIACIKENIPYYGIFGDTEHETFVTESLENQLHLLIEKDEWLQFALWLSENSYASSIEEKHKDSEKKASSSFTTPKKSTPTKDGSSSEKKPRKSFSTVSVADVDSDNLTESDSAADDAEEEDSPPPKRVKSTKSKAESTSK